MLRAMQSECRCLLRDELDAGVTLVAKGTLLLYLNMLNVVVVNCDIRFLFCTNVTSRRRMSLRETRPVLQAFMLILHTRRKTLSCGACVTRCSSGDL